MPARDNHGPIAADTGAGVGLLVASAMIPETFERSLSQRSSADQGMITGLSVGVQYLMTIAMHDLMRAVAVELANAAPPRAGADPAARRFQLTVLVDAAAVPLGLLVGRALAPRPGEPMLRGTLRQLGWRAAVTGVGGVLLVAGRAGAQAVDDRLGARGRLASFPVAVPVGLGVAYLMERRRVASPERDSEPQEKEESPSAMRSLAVAGGVVGGLALAAYGEQVLARQAGRGLSAVLPGGEHVWKLAGHAGFLALLGAGASTLWQRAMGRIEAGTEADQPIFGEDERTRVVGPTMSGGPDSRVGWESLGREGRRHMLTHVHARTVVDRPAGVPDLSIETVMKQPAKAEPVQVYVGLDSAASPRERVDLALAEMERTGAFDRSLLMLVSPTGTGYVNYVAVAAAEYLSLGDIATVTMQYSKRPSPLSLWMVKIAREQNRLLWLRILERLRRPGPRPRVVVFGESLGAHTSQDVFLHWGTLGPEALGIDRGLWIGTPYGSGWMHEVSGPDRLDVDRDEVAVVNDFEQLEALGPERRSRLRFVLVSHDNDGVTKFGTDLLTTPPAWLGPDRPKPEVVDGGSPRGIPPAMRWRPVTTFFQSLVDMKNAQLPGAYRAWAHDYRPDLPRFISEVFDLPATPQQMADIDAALRLREETRERLFAQATSG